jgi:hypothetical protein
MNILINSLLDLLVLLFNRVFKVSLVTAGIIGIVASISLYLSSYSAIVNGISVVIPSVVSGVWGWFAPDNYQLCLLSIQVAYVLRFSTFAYIKLYSLKLTTLVNIK